PNVRFSYFLNSLSFPTRRSSDLAARGVSQFSLGRTSTCAVISNEAYCWGYIALEDDSFRAAIPTKLDVGFSVRAIARDSSASHACFFGTAPSSLLRCWGPRRAIGVDSSTPIDDYQNPSRYPL